MPLTDTVAVGDWRLIRIDAESQEGIVKLYIGLPGSLNAASRTKACTIARNYGRVMNAGIRRGQLVVKMVVADLAGGKLSNEDGKHVKGMLKKLDENVTHRQRRQKIDHVNGRIELAPVKV